MFNFVKCNVAAIVATIGDYIFTIIAVQGVAINVVPASILGTIFGGIISFALGRNWVFNNTQTPKTTQLKKFFWVWCGNLLLNGSGLYFLTTYPINYIFAKIILSVFIAILYNYPLQKKYVFQH